jgi:hypothetical protein
MVLGLPDPDPFVRGTVRIRIWLQIPLTLSKNSKKPLIATVLWLIMIFFLSLKNDVDTALQQKH